MNKIIIKLYIPCLEKEYDVKIPTFLTIGEIIHLLTKSVAYLSNGKFYPSGSEILCAKNKNLLLDYKRQVCEYGIQNGYQLILF